MLCASSTQRCTFFQRFQRLRNNRTNPFCHVASATGEIFAKLRWIRWSVKKLLHLLPILCKIEKNIWILPRQLRHLCPKTESNLSLIEWCSTTNELPKHRVSRRGLCLMVASLDHIRTLRLKLSFAPLLPTSAIGFDPYSMLMSRSEKNKTIILLIQ